MMEPIRPGMSPPVPYAQPNPEGARSGDGRTTKGVIIGCAIGCGLALVVATASVVVLVVFGNKVFTSQVEDALRDNPVVQEHLGTLQDLEMDFAASSAKPGSDDFVFHATGSTASGTITATCITVDADTEQVVAGTLELDNGETYSLFPDQ